MNETQNIPKLRFEGFTEPWEQRKVSDIATLRRGLTYSPSDVVSPGQGVRVLRSSNVDEDRFVLRNDDVFVKEEAVNIPFSRDGEVLITAANGSTRLVGKRAKISGLMGKTVHGGFMLIAATEQPDFLCALMGTEWYRNFLRIGVAGGNGAIGNLDSHALECEKIRIPSSDEQHLVGGFFRDLDSLIDLQQRKYERLQHLKQALLRKMFPKPGEQVPELRFEGFTEPWKQRKLGDIAIIVAGGDANKRRLRPAGKYPVIANALTNDGIVGYYDDSYRIEAPAVTVTGRGEVGHAKARFTPFTPVVRLLAIVTKSDVSLIAEAINLTNIALESTGVPQLTVPQLASVQLRIPDAVEEQQAIGTFFHKLDSLIALHQREYERLRHLKQALLRKMFV